MSYWIRLRHQNGWKTPLFRRKAAGEEPTPKDTKTGHYTVHVFENPRLAEQEMARRWDFLKIRGYVEYTIVECDWRAPP